MDDFNIFNDKTYTGLLEDIYESTNNRSQLIQALINDLRDMVETPEDATMVIPMIVQYLDVGVKNDKHLVDLSNTIEKYKKNSAKTTIEAGSYSEISESELKYLEEKAREELLEETRGLKPGENDIEE